MLVRISFSILLLVLLLLSTRQAPVDSVSADGEQAISLASVDGSPAPTGININLRVAKYR